MHTWKLTAHKCNAFSVCFFLLFSISRNIVCILTYYLFDRFKRVDHLGRKFEFSLFHFSSSMFLLHNDSKFYFPIFSFHALWLSWKCDMELCIRYPISRGSFLNLWNWWRFSMNLLKIQPILLLISSSNIYDNFKIFIASCICISPSRIPGFS